MIYELVLRNFDCSLEFVFSLLLLQPFNISPISFACNFQDWGCVILREIDFLLKICWSIPCLHPSWKVHTWIEICASLNHRKKTKADGSRLIPRNHTETLVLLSVGKHLNSPLKLLPECARLITFLPFWKYSTFHRVVSVSVYTYPSIRLCFSQTWSVVECKI